MSMKKYYYIAVKTNSGFTFVTKRDNTSRVCYWNAKEKPLAMSKTVAEDTAWGLNLNCSYAIVVESIVNPITEQILLNTPPIVTKTKPSTECKIKLKGEGCAGKIIDMHFAYNDDFCEGCDNGIYYDIYDSEGKEIDGGQMDFNSGKKNYTDIKDAIPDLLEFAGYFKFTEDDYEIISEE